MEPWSIVQAVYLPWNIRAVMPRIAAKDKLKMGEPAGWKAGRLYASSEPEVASGALEKPHSLRGNDHAGSYVSPCYTTNVSEACIACA